MLNDPVFSSLIKAGMSYLYAKDAKSDLGSFKNRSFMLNCLCRCLVSVCIRIYNLPLYPRAAEPDGRALVIPELKPCSYFLLVPPLIW